MPFFMSVNSIGSDTHVRKFYPNSILLVLILALFAATSPARAEFAMNFNQAGLPGQFSGGYYCGVQTGRSGGGNTYRYFTGSFCAQTDTGSLIMIPYEGGTFRMEQIYDAATAKY